MADFWRIEQAEAHQAPPSSTRLRADASRLLAVSLLALTLGGCAEIGSALWLAELLTTQAAVPATAVTVSYQPTVQSSPGTSAPWAPQEPRVGSTGGSWTGVCDPVCPRPGGSR